MSHILRRLKLSRMRNLEPMPPVQRYEHPAPGNLLDLDIEKLGRIVSPSQRIASPATQTLGRGSMSHVAIDDHTRIAFSAISHAMAAACRTPRPQHRFTRPYTPRTKRRG